MTDCNLLPLTVPMVIIFGWHESKASIDEEANVKSEKSTI
jgi:hypothetical protein